MTSDVAAHRASRPVACADAISIVSFWRDAGRRLLWFAKDKAFDHLFHARYLLWHEAAARDELAAWSDTAEGALALLILLDQFPRNAFRGTPRMYASDATARGVANNSVAAGFDQEVERELQLFFYLPFGHSEDLADQERAVTLVARLGEPNFSRAEGHRDIIRRFRRFPHRNAILGRQATDEERRFLAEGGFAG